MTVEIELKFIANATGIKALTDHLNGLSVQHIAPRHLTNIYYETEDAFLRQHDMGLRIRSCDGKHEMTLKTAGTVVGGLHQRPEFNVELDKPKLDLALLPKDVWPEGCKLPALKKALNPLFSTDFIRECWVVTHQESEIEIAIDQGEVKAGELAEKIGEVEMELLKGNAADLLDFARQLTAMNGLRLGSQSKAARGYRLAKGNPERLLKALDVLIMPRKATVEQGFVASLEMALSHWQYHEELWLSGEPAAKGEVERAVAMLRQTLVLFGGLVPRKATVALRECWSELEAKLSHAECDPHTLCYSSTYLSCKLALVTWIQGAEWQAFLNDKTKSKLSGSFKRFADIMLGRCAAELKDSFSQQLTAEIYQDRLSRLEREVYSLYLLSGAYDAELRQPYIEAWYALSQAIQHNQAVYVDSCRKLALAQPVFWLNGGA